MFDVITFGSATWDIFVRDKEFAFKKDKRFFNEKAICFPLGSKIDVDEIHFSSGGGGTNTAVGFSRQGFKTAYCGMIGDDLAGDKVIDDLKRFKVDTSLVSKTDNQSTNHSIVISIPEKDRTILVYRGASENFLFSTHIKAKWFYLAPLSGKLANSFGRIIDFGFKNNIKIAVNPGNSQIRMPGIKEILKKTDILFLNQEEASFLTGISYNKEREILKNISSFYPGIFVMTKGKRGVVVSCGDKRYRAGALKSTVVDRTGAGDSFASGFVSGIIRKNDIEYAIQLASANATSCLKKWGAKNGLLEKGQRFKKIKVNYA